jgi:hypothetical protein
VGLAGAGVAAGATLSAAGTQADAANNATVTQAQEAQNALDFQKQQWDTQQKNEAPFLQAGQGAVTQLSSLMNNGGFPSWDQTFQAPTADQARQTPGYQFALDQGNQSVQNSAAARGGLLSGNTLAASQQYGQGLADSNYQQVYNNSLMQYQQSYNQFQNNQANQFNRLSTLAGGGQIAANQLGQEGQAAAQNSGNISIGLGQQIGNNLNNSAAARASGYVGAANSVNNGLSDLMQLALLNNSNNSVATAYYKPPGVNPTTTGTYDYGGLTPP